MSKEQQDQKDQENEAQTATWVVSPTPAMWPGGKCRDHEKQYDKNEQHLSASPFTLRTSFMVYPLQRRKLDASGLYWGVTSNGHHNWWAFLLNLPSALHLDELGPPVAIAHPRRVSQPDSPRRNNWLEKDNLMMTNLPHFEEGISPEEMKGLMDEMGTSGAPTSQTLEERSSENRSTSTRTTTHSRTGSL